MNDYSSSGSSDYDEKRVVTTQRMLLIDKRWPRILGGPEIEQTNVRLEVIRDVDNDTIMFNQTGNRIKEDATTGAAKGRFRYGKRASNMEDAGWYFERNLEADAAIGLVRKLLSHNLQRPNILQRSSKNNRLELQFGMLEYDVPGLAKIDILQKLVARPTHSFISIGDLSFHAMGGVASVFITRAHAETDMDMINNARQKDYFLRKGNGYLSMFPEVPYTIADTPLFLDPTWPEYSTSTTIDMVAQHKREEDLIFEALKLGGAKYVSRRWSFSNTCHHWLGYFINALIELDTHNWIIPSNWQIALNPKAVQLVEIMLARADAWRKVGKKLGRWRPIEFMWSNRDARCLRRQYGPDGVTIPSQPYTDP